MLFASWRASASGTAANHPRRGEAGAEAPGMPLLLVLGADDLLDLLPFTPKGGFDSM
jgi:hypothetical protein